MIVLGSATATLALITGSNQAIHVQVSWFDWSTSIPPPNQTPGSQNWIINSALTTTICESPAAGSGRCVEYVSIQNTGSSAETVTVQHYDGTTTVQIAKISLPAGYTLMYERHAGWILSDGSGNLQSGISPGRWLKTTVIAAGTTSFTTTSSTNSVRVRMCGGGGSGGGAPATTGEHGSGGGSGSYLEWDGYGGVSPSTQYTCAVGASVNGTSAANGTNGNGTSITFGSTALVCNGGGGGKVGTSATVPVLGGAPGAISTGGTLNLPGQPGEQPIESATTGVSGRGGHSLLGSGGAGILFSSTPGNSAAALGYGGGGGGAATIGSAEAGGASGPGVIIVEEYS